MWTVEGLGKEFLPSSAVYKYVDASHQEIRVQLSRFPDMLIAEHAISHVDRHLSLELRLASTVLESGASSTIDAGALEGPVLRATPQRMFRLASAAFPGLGFKLSSDVDSIFLSSTSDKPFEVRQ